MSKASALDMTLNESIGYLENLINKYSEAERLEQQITENESELRGSFELNNKRYSFFRCFWIYMFVALFSWYPLWLLASVLDDMGKNTFFCYALVFIVPIAILVVGGLIAGKQCHRNNENIAEHNKSLLKKKERLELDTFVLKAALEDKKKELEEASAILPENLRKSTAVTQMKTLLKSGTASTLQEAVDILRDSF